MRTTPSTRSARSARSAVAGLSALAIGLLPACSNNSASVEIPGLVVDTDPPAGQPDESDRTDPDQQLDSPPGTSSPSTDSEPTDSGPSEVTATTDASTSVSPTSPPPPPPPPPAPATTEDTTIYYRQGDAGPQIAVMQRKLITTGYLAPGSDSGTFDDATREALLKFQGDYGLGADGVFGPITNRSLTAAANSVGPN